MESKFKQYIVTDYRLLDRRLNILRNKLNPDIILLRDFYDSPEIRDAEQFVNIVFYIAAPTLEEEHRHIREQLRLNPLILARFILNAELTYEGHKQTEIEDDLIFGILPDTATDLHLCKNLANAFVHLQMVTDQFDLLHRINTAKYEINRLTRIGISLANEKDFDKLLGEILFSAREICNADSGSLYLVERDEINYVKSLRFKISALNVGEEFLLPINKASIAGYVAETGKVLNLPDVYNLPEGTEFTFNRNFDVLTNYHTKSMLVVPMKDHRGEVVGVLQLINRKRNFNQKLTAEQMKGEDVQPFDDYSSQLVLGVAGQAAVAIQNNYLLREIETLFEGFVTASVNAIEARDPTTSGHSFRVALLTVGLAETVDRADSGKYKDIKFSKEQLKEIRYASLLHDFGKVGVREKVLVKAKKLEDLELNVIDWRFRFLIKDLESRFNLKKVEYLKRHGTVGFADFEKSLEFEKVEEFKRLNSMLQIIRQSNEPSILEETNSHFLEEIAKIQYTTTDGESMDLLSPYEFGFLTIKKGSLDFDERKEIESHVEHTFQFLSKIPWTSDLKMVPAIAHAHHEKLNGSGYPRGLSGEDIPVQSRIMTISDIFDALTDKDRPYKKAVPLDRALDILEMESKDNHLDGDLLKMFIEAKVWERLSHHPHLTK
ncbi:GAF domain protein [Leptospira inadai serovar Lyme str. 10]|uniref:GAF domain protein n=2 Tax=Leptospira inadai serovar Lyme TaxID=293084 RepID=V6HCX1_9LEPT|nr:HD domain-containing phosphohydrolase [Leptospira inadai]EQA36808.1 GAF domain protein [Leptospira inadai serovar Lyme str. 10]PNV74635.1 HD family phosphohydrolase [Leptospira inadai serovar Lyme]